MTIRSMSKPVVSDVEMSILKVLKRRLESETEVPFSNINEISATSGINDGDDVLRALYTLEGKSLVSPQPEGDFTSQFWKITEVGMKAYTLIQ
jgi:hypothetical protein